jgi:hypothetical protein
MSAFQDLREWSWIWLLMHPHPAHAVWQFHPYHWQKSKTVGPTDNKSLGTGVYSAMLRSFGSPALCCAQMKGPLLEKVLLRTSATCIDFPSVWCGIAHDFLQGPMSLAGPVYQYWCWMFSKACGTYMLGLQIVSAWMHENTCVVGS